MLLPAKLYHGRRPNGAHSNISLIATLISRMGCVRMIFRSVVFASLCALAFGRPGRRDIQTHEARTHIPTGFSYAGAASPDTTLKLRLALVRKDDAGLIDTLYDVSTPSSTSYGSHLSKEEVRSIYILPLADSNEMYRSRRSCPHGRNLYLL